MKKCPKCGLVKPLDEFYKDKTRKDGRQLRCKVCLWAYQQQSDVQERNRKYQREYAREYQRSPLQERAYKKYQGEYRKQNAGAFAARNMARRAAKAHRTPMWLTESDWAQITQLYLDAAELSAIPFVEEPFHVDHVVPLQGCNVSGLHVPWNLQIITRTENVRKHNLWDIEEQC